MAATLSVAERCMALSRKVLTLGIGINSRRSAQEIFRQLSECANEFGSDMIALNYLPNRSMRAQQAVECVKCGQKVIYLLNLALREGMFDGKAVSEALQMAIVLENEAENLETGFALLGKLTDGKVYLGLKNGTSGVLNQVKNAEIRLFEGPHPAGNVGVQIHHIDPINKGDVVWTVDVQHVAMIGRFFRTGRVDMSKIVALTGSETAQPRYFSVITGLPINSIVRQKELRSQTEKVRIISGNVLTGRRVEPEGYLGFYSNQVTVIPEGDTYEFLGWGMPRLNKFSVSRSYFSWLSPKKHYRLDTNMNGGVRAYVVTGLYDKYLPMDIYPLYLLKAILAGDIDKMENLGIYEVIEEDFALCEFVDPSKTEMQAIIRQGIDLMIKELN